MRIWSLHPQYLDSAGLNACWREGLLARNVLLGNTVGYKNHPQLIRFKNTEHPVKYLDMYLTAVYEESVLRGFSYNPLKIERQIVLQTLDVTKGQVEYEFMHLMNKLKLRDPERYLSQLDEQTIMVHPLFHIIEGGIEQWEITKQL